MNCRDCLNQLAAWSADELNALEARSLEDHMAECAPCREEQIAFERTLLILSTASQPLLSSYDSQRIWAGCADHIFEKVETERLSSKQGTANQGGLLGWLSRQPRWSWASLAVAAIVFASVFAFAPREDESDPLPSNRVTQTNHGAGTLIVFENPPAAVSGVVNNHSAMAGDSFNDPVGSTLISYSATSPGR